MGNYDIALLSDRKNDRGTYQSYFKTLDQLDKLFNPYEQFSRNYGDKRAVRLRIDRRNLKPWLCFELFRCKAMSDEFRP